jgi:hypothetical protein
MIENVLYRRFQVPIQDEDSEKWDNIYQAT